MMEATLRYGSSNFWRAPMMLCGTAAHSLAATNSLDASVIRALGQQGVSVSADALGAYAGFAFGPAVATSIPCFSRGQQVARAQLALHVRPRRERALARDARVLVEQRIDDLGPEMGHADVVDVGERQHHPGVDRRRVLRLPGERLAQARGDDLVRLARFGHAGRVVVGQDDGRGIARQRLLDHFARVHAGAVHRAAEQLVEADQAMPAVEKQAAEHLVWAVAQSGNEEIPAVGRGADGLPGLIVDQYNNTIVFQISTLGMERMKDGLLKVLQSAF